MREMQIIQVTDRGAIQLGNRSDWVGKLELVGNHIAHLMPFQSAIAVHDQLFTIFIDFLQFYIQSLFRLQRNARRSGRFHFVQVVDVVVFIFTLHKQVVI